MDTILGIKFRDYGQIYFFTLPQNGAAPGRPEGDIPPAGPLPENPPCAGNKLPERGPAQVLSVASGAGVADTSAGGDAAVERHEVSDVSELPGLPGLPEFPDVLELAPCEHGELKPVGHSSGIRVGDTVVAETGQGPGLGMVVHIGRLPSGEQPDVLVPIVRVTGEGDRSAIEENRTLTTQAMRFCAGRIRFRGLEMKLVDVEVLFDKSKFIFYFTAPTRIDFRELVKDLVREYHVRIELRQIGVRHETQMIGAVGNCGMVCCCRRFLRKFAPVTIKMAKEQNLFLNPSKISGICGRLLCCLSYEQDNYDAFHRECPRLGKRYQTDKGDMKVLRANMFRNSVIVLGDTGEELEFPLEDWRALNPRRPEGALPVTLRPGGDGARSPEIPRRSGDGLLIAEAGPDGELLEPDDDATDLGAAEASDFSDSTADDNPGADDGNADRGGRRRT